MKVVSIYRTLPRAAFHVVVGVATAITLLLFPKLLILVVLTSVTVAFFALELVRLRVTPLKRCFSTWFASLLRKGEENKLTGSSYFLIGCLLTVLVFPQGLAALALLFLSLGDPTATIVGVWKGRVRLWGKSIEGDVACLIVCLSTSALITTILQHPPLAVVITGAVFAALFQALPLPLNDNLTIPLGSGGSMTIIGILMA